jgi:carotenoid cleavage dioxygenase
MLDDRILEFGMINNRRAGLPYRYTYTVSAKPGWFLFDGLHKFDVHTGAIDEYRFPEGVFASEAPFAPRAGAGADAAEDDGYVLTFSTDMNEDTSECLVFAAQDLAAGPVAKIRLPERISSGTHSCWAPAPG